MAHFRIQDLTDNILITLHRQSYYYLFHEFAQLNDSHFPLIHGTEALLENDVINIYENAKIELPSLVIRRLEEVEVFHRQLIENRREFLLTEINRLKSNISSKEQVIREKTEERAVLLEVLQTHGALEEHTKLQELYLKTISDLNELNKRMEELKKFEEGKSALKIEKERLLQRMRRDYEERHIQVERAIDLFNANSRFLYSAPGNLIIDVGDNGFQYRAALPHRQHQ